MNLWMSMNFNDSSSKIMWCMIDFYDFVMLISLMILVSIFYIMVWMLLNKLFSMSITHHHLLEVVWTLIPMVILVFMALPSLMILYKMEEGFGPYVTVKCIGHQWYWSYEYDDFSGKTFDSFMITSYSSYSSVYRLLDVDNRLILPQGRMVRGMVTSVDVIHSWAMPSIGVKVDAIPGRINQFNTLIDRGGLFFGQCSEICGLNHSFMPIVLESVNIKSFLKWVYVK